MAVSTRSLALQRPCRSVRASDLRPRPRASGVTVHARLGGGGGLLERPTFDNFDSSRDIGIAVLEPQTDADRNSGNTDRQKGSPPGGGDYRVLLIDSTNHTERQVVKAIVSVVPNADESHARNCFSTSKELGMAIVTTCLKEHAEHYAQQLYRFGCKAAIEPDGSTV